MAAANRLITWKAFAVEIRLGSRGDTTGAILARRTGAGIKFFLTMASHEFTRAETRVIGHLIDARPVIPAQIGQAVVAVDLASFTCVQRRTRRKKKT